MERRSAPAADPAPESSRLKGTFNATTFQAKDDLEVETHKDSTHVKTSTNMLNDQPGNVTEATPTPSPSTSGQAATHMELAPASRTAGDGGSVEGRQPSSGTINNPIDLTQEDNALQKALALSLQDIQQQSSGAQISQEDQDISRALEASLAERQGMMQQLGLPLSAVSIDPLNPHERKRIGRNPVGLKNIGNTCWFSAVVQSLFHIPEFREVVLQFQPPPLPNTPQSYHHCLQFLVELRCLFGLLLNSKRKYINPERAILALNAAFTEQATATAAQQDVSEFTHKLLEWIEIAFKTASENDDHNPVASLFTGHCRTEGVLEGQKFVNESDFGAFPIQVQGHTHLHDSLEAACVNTDMEQETWFTSLPPILVLELSRFSFNQSSSMVEKLHSRLAFDPTLSLDRYLERNKEEVRRRRREVAAFRHRLQYLRKRLNRYTHYQNRPVSVQDVLQLTLDFVHGHSSAVREGQEEVGDKGTGEKCPRTSVGPEPCFISPEERSTLDGCLKRWKQEMEDDVADLRDSVSVTEDSLAAVYSDEPMNSTRYHLHAVLVHQGQASGGHYWVYIRKPPSLHVETPSASQAHSGSISAPDVCMGGANLTKDLAGGSVGSVDDARADQTKPSQSSAEGTPGSCESSSSMVTEPSGEDRDSRLSVEAARSSETPGTSQQIVDEVADEVADEGGRGKEEREKESEEEEEEVWLKFNDVSVHEIRWEEVMRESYGGDQNTSAYCLLYISPQLHQSWAKNGMASQLPPDLQYAVEEDNTAFQLEMAEYDVEKERIAQAKQGQTEREEGSDDPTRSVPAPPGTTLGQTRATGSKADRSPEQMQVDSPPLPPIDTSLMTELNARLQEQYQRKATSLTEGEEWTIGQVRLQLSSICSYLILSGLGEEESIAPLLKVLLLQEVEGECEGGEKEGLRILAKKEIVSEMVKPGMQQMLDDLRSLHYAFQVVVHNFVYGVHGLAQKRPQQTLIHSAHAYRMNYEIAKKAGKRAVLDPNMVGLLRRRALQEVGMAAFRLFEEGEVSMALDMANHYLVPGLKAVGDYPCVGDDEVVEKIREEWCSCLMHPSLPEAEQDQLADLLTRMFEEFSKSSDLTVPQAPPLQALDPTHLSSDYISAVQQFRQLMKS